MEKMKCSKCGSQIKKMGEFGSGTMTLKDEREKNYPQLIEQYSCLNKNCQYYLKELNVFGKLMKDNMV